MNRYRKKPVVVEACQYNAGTEAGILTWGNGTIKKATPMQGYGRLFIETLEGIMVAWHGDYIVRGVEGEFYPWKPDIFKATYEPEGGVGPWKI